MQGSMMIPGGATLNTIRVASWMMQGKGDAAMISTVGDDTYAQRLIRECIKDNVAPLFATVNWETGTCAAAIVGNERSLVAHLGAAEHFPSSFMQLTDVRHSLEKATCVYMEGFPITHSFPVMLQLARFCAATNKVTLLRRSVRSTLSS